MVPMKVASEDLVVHSALVVIPDAGSPPWDDRPDAQEEGHTPRLKDAALGVPKRPALAVEQEPLLDGLVAQDRNGGELRT